MSSTHLDIGSSCAQVQYTIHHTLYTIHHTPYTIHHTPYTILIPELCVGSQAEKVRWHKAFTTAVGVDADGVGGHKRAAEFERDARKVHIATSKTYVLEEEEEEAKQDAKEEAKGREQSGEVTKEHVAEQGQSDNFGNRERSDSERSQFISETEEGQRSREGTAEDDQRGWAIPRNSKLDEVSATQDTPPASPSPLTTGVVTTTTYRLLDKVEINVRTGPSHGSEPSGSKVESGSTFEVLESRVVVGGRHDGGDQTFLKLGGEHAGGWVFLYHPSKGHALAELIQPIRSRDDNDSFLTRAFRRSSGFF
jgi:hypothetical protein